jgi:hypothetical protein
MTKCGHYGNARCNTKVKDVHANMKIQNVFCDVAFVPP